MTPALPTFFPRTAYVQLKTGIGDPAGDWQNRLVADYALDIQAAHAVLGPDPAQASLVTVSVPEQYGHWIPSGVCDNGIGYFEVANSRVVYQLDGQTRSFGIASMISWRGVWYVVHLGAILRGSAGGVVDDPASGPGTSAPSTHLLSRRPPGRPGAGGRQGGTTVNDGELGGSSAATSADEVGARGSRASSKKRVVSSRMPAAAGVPSMNEPRWSPPCSTTMTFEEFSAASNTSVASGYRPYSSADPTATNSEAPEGATVKGATPEGISPERQT